MDINASTAGRWFFPREWFPLLGILAAVFALLWAIWMVPGLNFSTATAPSLVSDKVPVILVGSFAAVALLVAWFLYCFTGAVGPEKIRHIIFFCYFFTLLALLGSVLPFVLFPSFPSLYRWMLKSPIGVVLGCANELQSLNGTHSIPSEIRCAQSGSAPTNQWIVNIGGAVAIAETPERKAAWQAVAITGGLPIPLYFVVLSLMGAAVSMTRRVPEYQRRVIQGGHVPPEDAAHAKEAAELASAAQAAHADEAAELAQTARGAQAHAAQMNPAAGLPAGVQAVHAAHATQAAQVKAVQAVEAARAVQGFITLDQAREYLVFQIMQVISAPLIAIAGYYFITTGSRASSVALGFAAGFASETVLLAIRALVEKLEPKTKIQTQSG